MAEAKEIRQALELLAKMGVTFGDVQKELKQLKSDGKIKSSGRGKAPSDDPTRLAIRDELLKVVVNKQPILNLVESSLEGNQTYMITLNDNFKVNFVKVVKKPPKAKKEKKVEPTTPEGFEEPAVV